MYEINIAKLSLGVAKLSWGLQTAKETMPLKLYMEGFVLAVFFLMKKKENEKKKQKNLQDFKEKIAVFRSPNFFHCLGAF